MGGLQSKAYIGSNYLHTLKATPRPATKGARGRSLPGSNLALLKFSELLFILLYIVPVCFYPPPQTLVCPPLRYFCPTMEWFLVAAPTLLSPMYCIPVCHITDAYTSASVTFN